MDQQELKKAYVNLASLKKNLPASRDLEVKYLKMFHNEIERLIALGLDLQDFKLPEEELRPIFIGGNYITGEKRYSKEKYVSRDILMMKLDAVLEYFQILHPETQIGFALN